MPSVSEKNLPKDRPLWLSFEVAGLTEPVCFRYQDTGKHKGSYSEILVSGVEGAARDRAIKLEKFLQGNGVPFVSDRSTRPKHFNNLYVSVYVPARDVPKLLALPHQETYSHG